MRATLGVGIAVLFAVAPSSGASRAGVDPPGRAPASDPGRNLSQSAEHDIFPDISGTRVVWERYPGRLVLYDLATGQAVTLSPPAGSSDLLASIDGERIVFVRLPSVGDWQIMVHDIATGAEYQIATYPRSYGLGRLRISGDLVVWHAPHDGGWDIYLHDLASGAGRWLISDAAEDADPDVDGHVVAWLRRASSWWDVWVRDLSTGQETRLTDGTAARGPRVSGDRVVWGDARGNYLLYEHRLSTGLTRPVPNATEMESNLTLDGNRMAWVSRTARDLYDDVVLYDFDTERETKLTSLPVRQWVPELSGQRLVWEDYRNGNADVYLYDTTPTPSSFYTVEPCRVIDTRGPDGPRGGPALAAKATRSFPVTGVCGVPADATSLAVSVTVTQGGAGGALTIYPPDAIVPLASVVNWGAWLTRTSNAAIKLASDGSGTVSVRNLSTASVHVVLDVNGYFR